MANVKHNMVLSVTESNNNVGLIKVRAGDDETQVFEVLVTENGLIKPFDGLTPFFCLMAREITGQGVSEEPVATFDGKNGRLEYTLSANAFQMIGKNEAYFSFRKQSGTQWVEQFSTRSFYYTVEHSIYTQPFKDSNYWFTFKELYQQFLNYQKNGKTSWEDFVEQNKEIIESVDPGGQVLTELIAARNGKSNLKTRLDDEHAQVTAQLQQTEQELSSQLAQKVSLDDSLSSALSSMANNISTHTIVQDTFSLGTSSLGVTNTGQYWEEIEGSFSVGDNIVKGATLSTWNKGVVDSGYINGEVSAVFRSFEGAPRLLFRVKDPSNYFYFGVATEEVDNRLRVGKVVDGIHTGVITVNYILGKSKGSRFRVVLSGNRISVYVNNLHIHSFEENALMSETKHGFSLFGDNGAITSFKVETLKDIQHPRNLIASVDNMLVSYDGSHLLLSEDGGASYRKGLAIPNVGTIKYIHLFGNGNVLFADHQNVYYSRDWETYGVSTVLNEDGTPYSPEPYDNFSCYKNGTVKKIVEGKEIAVWGNYSTQSSVQFTDKIKVWYSDDYGQTVKCCYTFNTPTTLPTRHIHAVDFNPNDETFWLQTGDEPVDGVDMSHWIKGEYDLSNDHWSWEPFASGLAFKTTNMIFHTDGYVYWSWDKTPGGAVRAPITSMGDESTHELLFETDKDCHFLIVGKNGDIAIFQTAWGGTEQPRVFYYAPDGINFERIQGVMPLEFEHVEDAQYQTYWPVNNEGKVLAGVQSLSRQNIRDWDRKPSVFIDEILAENGFPNAFK